jgi:hypothetical protein
MSLYNIVSPASLVPGQPEDVSQVLANFQAIQAVLNGGIDDVNIRSTAAIAPSKFAGYPANVLMSLRGDGSWQRTPPTVTKITGTGAGTYTVPAGVKALLVELYGAGGGAAGAAAAPAGWVQFGGGGGGGGYCAQLIQGPLAATYAYSVGVGGAAGNNTGTAGGGGGDTFFNDTGSGPRAYGGSGGLYTGGNTLPWVVYAGGAGGGNLGGDYGIQGQGGGYATFWSATTGLGSPGGDSARGGKGALPRAIMPSIVQSNPGSPGNVPGGGGSGATIGQSSGGQAGGAGANGLIVIWEFY